VKTNNPMRGLFTLTYYRTRNVLLTSLAGIVVIGLAFLATEEEILYNMFVIFCMIHFPVQALGGMGGNEGRWERFQVSMPIKRSYLLKAQYLSVIFIVICGAVILTAGIAISSVIHEDFFMYGFSSAIASSVHSYGMALLAIGLAFLLSFILPHTITGFVAFIVPSLINVFVPVIAEWLNASVYIVSASVLFISIVIFVISYFVSKVMYEKSDF